MVKSRSLIATPPGATIKEQLHDRGISQKEFALRMDMSEKHISKLINGEVQLTPDVAVRLETVLGVPAKFWNNLEATYREKIIRANAENEMDADKILAKNLPYNKMSTIGWIPKTCDSSKQVLYLRKYFEVVNLEIIQNKQLSKIACCWENNTEKDNLALLAWAQKAKLEARNIKTEPINLKRLEKNLPVIKNMMTMDPDSFFPKLVSLFANCGIALVFLPNIGGSFLNGATFYDGKKIIVGISVYDKDAYKFWFSLFHELGHILLGHINQPNGTTDADENAADDFAKKILN